MNGHGDHSDLWNYYDGLREDLGRAEERIAALEQRAEDQEKRLHNIAVKTAWELTGIREAIDRLTAVVRRYTGGP